MRDLNVDLRNQLIEFNNALLDRLHLQTLSAIKNAFSRAVSFSEKVNMVHLFRLFLAPALLVVTSFAMAASGGIIYEKIKLRLNIAGIEDAGLKTQAVSAADDIADTIGALSHSVLRKDEIEKKISWTGSRELMLAPQSPCPNGVGAITPSGRPIIRQAYDFMRADNWHKENDGSISFSAKYVDAVSPDNVAVYKYFFAKDGLRWRLFKQEIVLNNIVHAKC